MRSGRPPTGCARRSSTSSPTATATRSRTRASSTFSPAPARSASRRCRAARAYALFVEEGVEARGLIRAQYRGARPDRPHPHLPPRRDRGSARPGPSRPSTSSSPTRPMAGARRAGACRRRWPAAGSKPGALCVLEERAKAEIAPIRGFERARTARYRRFAARLPYAPAMLPWHSRRLHAAICCASPGRRLRSRSRSIACAVLPRPRRSSAFVAVGFLGMLPAAAPTPDVRQDATSLHPRQRAAGGGHPRPSRAGRHPHGLVQGRRRRRAARQIGHRPFPRAPDVQGHQGPSRRASSRRWSTRSAATRTPSPPTTTPPITRTSPRSTSALMMEFEADRMANLVLDEAAVATEREVILEERRSRDRQRSRRAARRGGAARRSSRTAATASRPSAGRTRWRRSTVADALAFYDRYYTPNNADRWSSPATSPRTRCASSPRRPTARCRAAPSRRRATAPREPEPLAARTVTLVRPAGHPALDAARLPGAVLRDRRAGRGRGARRPRRDPRRRHHQPALPRPRRRQGDRRLGRRLLPVEHRSATRCSASTACRAATRRSTQLEAAIDAEIAERRRQRRHRGRSSPAPSAGCSPRPSTPQDSHGALARVFGTALATGSTLDEAQDWPAAIDAVTVDQVNAGGAQISRHPALGHRLSRRRPSREPVLIPEHRRP